MTALALATYTDLQATVLAFMERTGEQASVDAVPVWIQLAEAKLNRELGPVETDQTLTGVVGSRALDISALTIVEPIRLWFKPASSVNEVELEQVPTANLPQNVNNAPPIAWCMHNQSELRLDSPVNDTYSFRFRYRGRFSLSSTSTNWLLTQHPDVYLAATLFWGAGFHEDATGLPMTKAEFDEALAGVKHTLAQTQRGTLRVDPALRIRKWAYNINSDN